MPEKNIQKIELKEIRQALEKNPCLIKIANFWQHYEQQLEELYIQYTIEAGESLSMEAFVTAVYYNHQDLIIKPVGRSTNGFRPELN